MADIVEERLVTKQGVAILQRDIKELEEYLRHNMKELETSLRRELKDMEYRLTIKLGGILAVSVTIVSAFVKLL